MLLEKYSQTKPEKPGLYRMMPTIPTPEKTYAEQPRIVSSVLHSRSVNSEIANLVKGVMVESYLLPGSQKVNQHEYGKSITDPCLGWDETEKLLDKIAESL